MDKIILINIYTPMRGPQVSSPYKSIDYALSGQMHLMLKSLLYRNGNLCEM